MVDSILVGFLFKFVSVKSHISGKAMRKYQWTFAELNPRSTNSSNAKILKLFKSEFYCTSVMKMDIDIRSFLITDLHMKNKTKKKKKGDVVSETKPDPGLRNQTSTFSVGHFVDQHILQNYLAWYQDFWDHGIKYLGFMLASVGTLKCPTLDWHINHSFVIPETIFCDIT